jgi:hypothetical protein
MSDWHGTLRLQTSNPTIYDILVEEEKLFNYRYHLFGIGLVYGILHDKKDESAKKNSFIPISTLDGHVKELLDICYLILDDGSGTKKIFDEMCVYADGGIIELNEIYKQNHSFTLSNLFKDSEELWKAKVKDLNNINFK